MGSGPWKSLSRLIRRDRVARKRGEDDAPADLGMAGSRETGGGTDVETQDSNSTTGTSESGTFVGRASGDESGDVGISGAEGRGGRQDHRGIGAARDE